MPRNVPKNDEGADDTLRTQPGGAPEDDTEGHSLLIDPSAARALARSRSQDVDRDARERQRQKEARPNRDRAG